MNKKTNNAVCEKEISSKKVYKTPEVKTLDISKALMVAASRSGMGNCKITFL